MRILLQRVTHASVVVDGATTGSIDRGYEGRPVAHGWVEARAAWCEIDDDLPRFERGFPNAPPGAE